MTPFDLDVPTVALAVLVVVMGAGLFTTTTSSTAAFSPYNSAWDGTAELRSLADDAGMDSRVVYDSRGYDTVEANQTVAVVLSPDSGYTAREASRVREFVLAGGTLVVAEDFGPHSNALLTSVGASARVDGALLRDKWRYFKKTALPRATGVRDIERLEGVDHVILNHGTAVRPGSATVLVSSAPSAYLDRNRDRVIDGGEEVRAYPVASIESVGTGTVVVVSDPSVFINELVNRPNNRAFARAVVAPSEHDLLLLDRSHTQERSPLLWVALARIQTIPGLPIFSTAAGLAFVGLLSSRNRIRRLFQRLRDKLPSVLGRTGEARDLGRSSEQPPRE